jgi:hypothetical protein
LPESPRVRSHSAPTSRTQKLKLKLFGATGWYRVAGMVSKPEVSSSNPSGHDLSK